MKNEGLTLLFLLYKNFTTSSNAEFKVKTEWGRFLEKKFNVIIIIGIVAAVLIAIAIFIYLRIIKRKEEKLEKKGEKLEKEIEGLKKKEGWIKRIRKKKWGRRKSKRWQK